MYVFLNWKKMKREKNGLKKKVCIEHVALILFVCSFFSLYLSRSLFGSLFCMDVFICIFFHFFHFSLHRLTFDQYDFHFVFGTLSLGPPPPHHKRVQWATTWKYKKNTKMKRSIAFYLAWKKFHLTEWQFLSGSNFCFSFFVCFRHRWLFACCWSHRTCILRGNLAEIEWFISELNWSTVCMLHNTARLLI